MKVRELKQLLESSDDEAVVIFQEESLTAGFTHLRDPRKSFTIGSVLDDGDGFCVLISDEEN